MCTTMSQKTVQPHSKGLGHDFACIARRDSCDRVSAGNSSLEVTDVAIELDALT